MDNPLRTIVLKEIFNFDDETATFPNSHGDISIEKDRGTDDIDVEEAELGDIAYLLYTSGRHSALFYRIILQVSDERYFISVQALQENPKAA